MSADLRHEVLTALNLGPATFVMLMQRLPLWADSVAVHRQLFALREAGLIERIAVAGVLAHPIWRIPSDLTLPEQLRDLPEYHQKLMALAMGMWPQEDKAPEPGSAPKTIYEERKAGRTSDAIAEGIRARCPKRNALPATFRMEHAIVVALFEGNTTTHGVLRRITAYYFLVPGVLDIFDVEDHLKKMQEEGKLGRTGEPTGQRWFLKPSFYRDRPHRELVLIKNGLKAEEDVATPEQEHVLSLEQSILRMVMLGRSK